MTYTPLETLLLFSALRAEGAASNHSNHNNDQDNLNFSFNRISEQLKNVPIIREDPSYDGGRLSPDALREQYLWLLKQEAKRDLEQQDDKSHAATNGNVSPNARKRKVSSPTLPTVQDAAQHSHLIPQLVNRLYATYREHAVREIREHERRHDVLSREIKDIEDGKWDEQLQRQQGASVPATQSPKLPASVNVSNPPSAIRADATRPSQDPAAPVASRSPPKPTEPSAQPPPKRYSQARIDAVINHDPEPQNGPSVHRRTSSGTTLPPLHEMAPHSPRFAPLAGPVTSTMGMQQPYSQSPPIGHHSPYQPHHAHPMPSPRLPNTMARPSSSPRPILPPPPGMNMTLPPPSPVHHMGSPGMRGPPIPPQQHYQPQHRSPMGPSPTDGRPPQAYPPPQLPAHPGYYQQQPFPDRRTSYTHQAPAAPHPAPPRYHAQPPGQVPHGAPHHGGVQLQPWLVDGAPQQVRPAPRQQLLPSQAPPRPLLTPAHTPRQAPPSQYPATAPKASQSKNSIIGDLIGALATPPRPQREAVWRSERRPRPVDAPKSPPNPGCEPMSPVKERAKSPARINRPARKRDVAQKDERRSPESVPAKGRTRRVRNHSPHSVLSSQTDELARTRTRSQSVSTAVGAADRRGSRSDVKHEPSTPAEMADAPDHEPSATPASGPMTRKRRGTLQSQPQPPTKRKRQQSPATTARDDADDLGTPPPRPTTVTAKRNFAKMAQTLMNDITGHKYANYFAGPVRDKDASGYSGIIKHAQHLKAIRAAITHGSRAVAAATVSVDSPSATPSATASKAADGSTVVELERSSDLVPPKAIVNGTQLEKEVYRMFANAVMFNPGEDGLVADTRSMFEDVEAMIREWRGAETGVPGGGEEDAADEVKGKRRKL